MPSFKRSTPLLDIFCVYATEETRRKMSEARKAYYRKLKQAKQKL